MIKDLYKSFKENAFIIIIFEVFYRAIAAIIIMPIWNILFKLALRFSKTNYIRFDNLNHILKEPEVLLIFILMFIILSIYIIFELSVIIRILNEDVKAGHIFGIMKASLYDTLRVLNFKNWALFAFILFILPVNIVSISPNFFNKLKIPSFIMDTILNDSMLTIFYIGIFLFIGYINYRGLYSFNIFFTKSETAYRSIKESFILTKKNFIKNIVRFIIYSQLILSIIAVITQLISYINLLIVNYSSNNDLFFSIALSYSKTIDVASGFIYSSLTILINLMVITIMYKGADKTVVNTNRRNYKLIKLPKYTKSMISLFILIFMIFNFWINFSFINEESFWNEGSVKTYITAHRGSSLDAPENTIAAIKKAIKEKSDFCEIDVRLTRDGEVVLFHDDTLKRISVNEEFKKYRIEELDLEKVKKIDAGSWFNERFRGEKIPTLKEVIDITKNKIRLNIEIKPYNNEEVLSKAIIEILEKNKLINNSIITSLNKRSLNIIKEEKPEIKVGYILPIAIGDFYKNENFDFYSIEASYVNADLVNKLQKIGKNIHVWTINTEEEMIKMFDIGVYSIITDKPNLAFVKKKSYRPIDIIFRFITDSFKNINF